jgi:hypothetical protein
MRKKRFRYPEDEAQGMKYSFKRAKSREESGETDCLQAVRAIVNKY